MTKGRAYRIVWSVAAFGWGVAFTFLGLAVAFGIEPFLTASIIILITSIIWVGGPLTLILDGDLPDPKSDRREEERELLKVALESLRNDLLRTLREHDPHEYVYEEAVSILRSCKERARHGGVPYTHIWWDW